MMNLDLNILIHSLVISSFALMQFLEMSSFGARIAGKLSNRTGLGTTLQQSIYTGSRIFLIIFLPALGYIVEFGVSFKIYIIIILITYSLSLMFSIYMLVRLNVFQVFFQKVFSNYENNTIPFAFLKTIFHNNNELQPILCDAFSIKNIFWKKTFVSFLAYIFLISSYFLAFTLAILYPENRLTLTQFTAVFHSFGAIIMSFYLDPMLSRSIDSDPEDLTWLKNTYSILVGRIVSYIFAILVLTILVFQ
jgi:hypothetical protein